MAGTMIFGGVESTRARRTGRPLDVMTAHFGACGWGRGRDAGRRGCGPCGEGGVCCEAGPTGLHRAAVEVGLDLHKASVRQPSAWARAPKQRRFRLARPSISL